ncbi:MAG: (Fe-S)-binding protein [Desulfosarcina sp.]|nr:(Fe-S)-binding protein [Desulfosarcina sp.]MBC2743723.1 (Fe-S)-binding protein [Desulfosarcina sp.]MBC2766632.1 (Fe-S)-binding protein [Desulfosarcina sp.]
MASMEELARLMRELEDQLVVCMRCGMCQSVCPVFDQTGREADVARGKLALLSGLMESMFDDPEGVYQRLNKCLLCGSCTANCPSGVSVQEIFLKARAILTGTIGLSPAKRLILKGMLANPALFDRLTEWGARFQKIFTRPVNDIVGTSCARVMSPLIQDRHFRTLAPVSFHRQVPSIERPAGKSGLKVALFTGCLIDKMFPAIAHSTIKVLDHFGVGIYLPENQGCCGIPALAGGDLPTFQKLLAHNLKHFETGDFDVLVTACATCTSTIHEVWPKMADQRNRKAAARLARRTMDINQFLVKEAKLRPLTDSKGKIRTVTYHDPCHLKKSLRVFNEPRAVINAIPGCKLTEMAEPDWCCGMGGSFNLQYYDISKGIGQKKAAQIIDTGADVLATGCPACMIQICDMLSQAGADIAVRHPVELFAEALDE